ncbi:MAG TPA: STAS domain-containing protein [Acidobacteriaceae bacterium]|jgi:anti-anti-sigma factor
MPLTLNTRYCGSVYVIQCTGDIVLGDAERTLDTALDHAERQFQRFVLNLTGITRLDSMGLGLLVRHSLRLAKRGGALRLAGSPPFVTKLLDLTRLSAVMPNFATEDDAILSFMERGYAQPAAAKSARRLLIFDPSPDLCTFARSVLSSRGFDVRTTCAFGDAKLLLRVDPVEYILIGPGTPQIPAEMAAHELAALAPGASVLQLGADFKSRDALDATQSLIQMFGIGGGSPASA